jgi:hypothetical protein
MSHAQMGHTCAFLVGAMYLYHDLPFVRTKEPDREMEFRLSCDTLANGRSLNTKSLNAPTHHPRHEKTMDSKRLALEQILVEWRDIKPTKKTREIAEEWRNLGRHVKRRG